MDWAALIGAFGLGSVATTLLQSWLGARVQRGERAFSERKEAFTGLLDAYHRAAVEGTDEAAKNFAYWQMRCELVSGEKVRSAIQAIIDTNDDPAKRALAHEDLKEEIRKELGISE